MPAGGAGYRPAVLAKRNPCDPEDARRFELERALGLLQSGKAPEQVMEALSQRLTNKLLHRPTKMLVR